MGEGGCVVTNDEQLGAHRAVVPRLGPRLLLRRRREQHLRHAVQPAVRHAAARLRPQVRLQPHRLQPEGHRHAGGDRLRAAGASSTASSRGAAPTSTRLMDGAAALRGPAAPAARRRRIRSRRGSGSSSRCARTPASRRADLVRFLEANRIETRSLFAGNLLRHPAFQDIPHRIVGDLANTDTVMNDTFFVGVYPGLDAARLDHMAAVFDRFMRGERVPALRSRDGMAGDAEARVRGRADRRARRARLHAWRCGPSGRCRASAPGSSCTWRSIRTIRRGSGRTRACSRSPARRPSATAFASPTPCTGGSRRAWSAIWSRAGRSGSRCRTATSSSTAARDVVLFAGGTGITAFTAFLEGLTAGDARSRSPSPTAPARSAC